ncbi:hypothetical protein Ari01nite_29520 [Paractinoplanes rishiriensis]|uniref:Uncharacterized protein n=1 Tax=Paractinoplanes rishiriensis TaxID=1050105 RepID=A0A919JY77_9ACTN|nr:hypothetical protein Ari01nite_29520 [Actinoplanes rishiriensis]
MGGGRRARDGEQDECGDGECRATYASEHGWRSFHAEGSGAWMGVTRHVGEGTLFETLMSVNESVIGSGIEN